MPPFSQAVTWIQCPSAIYVPKPCLYQNERKHIQVEQVIVLYRVLLCTCRYKPNQKAVQQPVQIQPLNIGGSGNGMENELYNIHLMKG